MTKYEVGSLKVGRGTKVHGTYVGEWKTVTKFGRTEQVPAHTVLPVCGASIALRGGGFGGVMVIKAPVNCERCLRTIAADTAAGNV